MMRVSPTSEARFQRAMQDPARLSSADDDGSCMVGPRSVASEMPSNARWYYLLGQIALVGSILAFYLLFVNAWAEYPTNSDFGKFYMSVQLFLEGKDIYSPVPVDAFGTPPAGFKGIKGALHPNLNPPFETLLLAPLGRFGYRVAFGIWSVLSILCGIIAVTLIEHATRGDHRRPTRVLGLLLLLLVYFPTYITVIYGQFSLFLLLLLAIAWTASRSGRDRIAGVSLGLATSLKPFTGIFLILFLVRRRWRLLSWFAGTFLICGLAGLLVFGVDTYLRFWAVLREITWYSASWNASFTGFFTRIFGGSENIPLFNAPELAHALTYGASFLVILCLAWLAGPRSGSRPAERFDLAFSFSIVAMLLLSPLGWMYYFPVLLIPALVAWHISETLSAAHLHKAMIILAWLLSTTPHWLVPSSEMNGPLGWLTWAGVYFYALLILGLEIVLLARHLNHGSLLIPAERIRRPSAGPQAYRGPTTLAR